MKSFLAHFPLVSALALLACALFAGCAGMSKEQQLALAGAESGNAYATYVLTKAPDPASKALAVKALTDLAVELPNIPLGKVTAFQLGQLNGELQAAKANLISNPQAENQIVSFISLVANNQGTLTGGIVTADQALVFGAFQNVATGIGNAVQFALGQASVTAPGS